MASNKNHNYKDKIIWLADVENGDASLQPLFDEFVFFWAENYPDKPRKPEYFDKWLEERYGIRKT